MRLTLADLARREHHDALAAVLRTWLPAQRWFAGKARRVTGMSVADAFVVGADGVEVLDVLVEVAFADGGTELYQVPVSADAAAPDEAVIATRPDLRLVDATYVAGVTLLLAGLTRDERERTLPSGRTLVGRPVGEAVNLAEPRRTNAEQSNTSVIVGSQIFKVFRKLERGENPDVEITHALTAAGFPHTPRQRGALLLREPDGVTTAVGVLVDFVPGAREGWELATAEVAAVTAGGTPTTLLDAAADLGAAVADLHATLRDTLGTRAAGRADRAAWADGMAAQLDRVLATARERAPADCAVVLQRSDEIRAHLQRLRDDDSPAPLTRTHGDLHLGQVLLDASGTWQILDFEGEPARPLHERRELQAPLRDVAGMLRSFDYAAAVGSGGDLGAVPAAAARLRDDARGRFLSSYLETAGKHGVLPATPAGVDAQLEAFELDKAIYELGYELANRPGWVAIPVGGIVRVLDRT